MQLRKTRATAFDPFLPPGRAIFARRLSNSSDVSAPAQDIVGPDLGQFLLQRRVLELEGELSAAKQDLERREERRATRLVSLIGPIRELSERLFPGPVTFDYASDPEDPTHEYLVFDVAAKGDYADYRDRIIAWHDEIDRIVPNNDGAFRLIVHPQP